MSGIYFLFKKGILIYIGQTTNLKTRLVAHKWRRYDSYRFIHCDNEKRRIRYELILIKKFKPKMNFKRIQGRPSKFNFRMRIGKSRDFKFSESTRVCALQWGDRHGFLFSTEKRGEVLTVTRLK